ncbi:hypothetical protein DIPPA_28898 [Diplonema papillatum]|nr:hypothetical protein DIPPA_28898 [Diplonema papillatum]
MAHYSPPLPTICVALSYAVAAMAANDDDGFDNDLCRDPRTGGLVRTGDCEHNCCIDGECGSESACRAAWVIAIIVVGVVVCCGCIAAALVFAYCTKKGPFARRQTVSQTTYQGGGGYPMQPQQAYPSHPQAQPYPQQAYPQAQAYPQQQPAYPPQQQAYPPPAQYDGGAVAQGYPAPPQRQ